ncbi:MAG: Hydroxycarboxylate dehydrogenase B [Anaerolineales bacterium]|nr:Hydroxycarboxylate dehydrogenase B [Anaerolineales bacterium]
MPVVKPVVLSDFVSRIFQAAGATEEGARLVAESLVASDLAGHESHGVVRVHQYLGSIDDEGLDPAAEPTIARETPTNALVDAHQGFGQVAAHFAMNVALEKAQAQGLAATGLFNCNHVGRLGEWVQMAADQEMVGLAFCNGGRPGGIVAPYGGASRLLGTNPIAAAVPVEGRPPLVMDFATSVVAEGKVRVARNRGKSLPEGWIQRSDGQPSADPEDLYADGVLLPAADHKGYGLALLIEFLGGLLTGAGWPGQPDFTTSNGVLFLALSGEAFRPTEAFLADGAELCEQVKETPPAAGFDEVLLPGEPEQRTAERRRTEGIPVDGATWTQLTAAATELGVVVPS